MRPEDVGLERSHLVLGKHSGRHAFRKRLEEMGFEVDEQHFEHLFQEFKALSDKKKAIYDEDIEALVLEELEEIPDIYKLVSFHTSSGSAVIPTATVRMEVEGKGLVTDAATGDGPIDAVYRAVDRITGMQCELIDYGIRAITSGKDAMGEVFLEVRYGKMREHGRATSTDIIEGSTHAYLSAVNKLTKRVQNGEAGRQGKRTKAGRRRRQP